MKKTFNLLVSSVALLAVTGGALNASEPATAKYDNKNHVINPDGKKAFVLKYVENANGLLDKQLTINVPELPYKASFDLCADVKEAEGCKGTIFLREDEGEYLVDYNVNFLYGMKAGKALKTEVIMEESPMALNEIVDEDEIFNYTTLSTHKSHWMLTK